MKISTTVQATIIPQEPQAVKPAEHESATAQAHQKPENEAFRVRLTEMAKQINDPVKSDEISHDKVAAIRDQLAAGTYSISGKDVANKILRSLKG